MIVPETLKKTPLYDEHLALNARMVAFGGWEMPVQYEGILAEHKAARESVALFDISHMGEFRIKGDALTSGLDRIVTMPITDMPIKTCRYGAILNNEGGIIDDLIVFREEQEKWFLVVNGATTEKDAQHFQKHLTEKAAFQDLSMDIGKLDVQGPQSRSVLSKLVKDIEKLKYYSFDYFELLGEHVLISRTGYTGELGFEIYYPWNKTKELWNVLLKDERVKPAGLGARDVLRLEVGYSLYGHELNEGVSPLESGLTRFIDFNKDFIGKNALLKEKEAGVKHKVVGFTSDNRRSPREQHKIFSSTNKEIGVVTSGSFSPCVQAGIGLGFVNSDSVKAGDKILFGDEKNKTSAVITGKSFYKNGSLKN